MISDIASLVTSTLTSMTPLILAGVGEIITERSGVVNIGLEGILLVSAFSSTVISFQTGNPYLGLLVGLLVGLGAGVLHGFISVYLKGDQIIAGVGFNSFAYGIGVLGLIALWKTFGASPGVPKMAFITIPVGENASIGFSPIALIAVAVAIIAWWWLFKTNSGLKLRACGEDPRAAEGMGVNVDRMRFYATVIGGLLTGLGGAFLVVGWIGQYTRNISAGRGFIALANVAFSNWNPLIAIAGGVLFGFFDVLSIYLPVKIQMLYPGVNLTAVSYLFRTIPYLGTLLVVSLVLRRVKMPKALGKPYIKE